MATATKKAKFKGRTGKKKGEEKKPEAGGTLAQRRARIRARHEKSTVVYSGDVDKTTFYKTRFPKLNAHLGGGIRAGAIIEIYAMEDCGKSTLSIALAADIQRQAPKGKRTVLLVNYELTFDYAWAETNGLDTNEEGDHPAFIHLQPKNLEEGIGDTIDLVETGEICCVIYDSVYAAESREGRAAVKAWAQSDGKKAGMAVEARAWGRAWTSLKGLFKDFDAVCIAVNQAREDMELGGAPKKGFHGKKISSTRGAALKFYAWVRLEIAASSFDPEARPGQDGRVVKIRIVKNKTSGDARGRVVYDLVRGVGFDLVSDLLELALEAGIVKGGGGGFFTIGETKIRGRDRLMALISGSERLQNKIQAAVDRWLAKTVEPVDETPVVEDEEPAPVARKKIATATPKAAAAAEESNGEGEGPEED